MRGLMKNALHDKLLESAYMIFKNQDGVLDQDGFKLAFDWVNQMMELINEDYGSNKKTSPVMPSLPSFPDPLNPYQPVSPWDTKPNPYHPMNPWITPLNPYQPVSPWTNPAYPHDYYKVWCSNDSTSINFLNN